MSWATPWSRTWRRWDWRATGLPLLWFGIYAAPESIARADLAAAGRAYAGPLRHEWDETAYTRRFDRVHDYIGAGDIYQANLSFRSRFAFAGDPLALYLRLRDRAQAAHGAYIGRRRAADPEPLAPSCSSASPRRGASWRGR